MLKKLLKKLNQKQQQQANQKTQDNHVPVQFRGNLDETEKKLKELFGNAVDLNLEKVQFAKRKGLLCYLRSLSDWEVVATKILQPITHVNLSVETIQTEEDWLKIGKNTFSGTFHRFIQDEKKIIEAILNGEAVFFVEGFSSVLAIMIRAADYRGIEEPSTQTIIRGPKEGFNENIETSMSLIRRKLRVTSLRFEEQTIGSETPTKVCLVYLDGVINPKFVAEARARLKKVHLNALLESGTLEEMLEDKTMTPFPMLYNSERPDTIVAHLLSGKFAILVDGSPFVLTAPTVFNDFISISEDYYQKFMMGSFIRLIRYLSFLIATLLPAFFVSIITYHHELIPTPLIISIISQREGIPFPAIVEALLMEITFEILREAGIRMPRAVGGTISIVGGLVIGQAAVEAGIVSNIMVIVVALTAISSFVLPIYTFAISTRLLRFMFLILGAMFGLYGVFLGMIAMVAHLASLRSFGVPYLAPFAPFHLADQDDTFFRLPNWMMQTRPSYLKTVTPVKDEEMKQPSPPPLKEAEKS